MSEIYVQSSAALSEVIQELATLNQEYMNKVEGLDREQANLVHAWEGEASDAFQERYRRERDFFCAFATVVTEYISALARILATYEQAEANNVMIAGDGFSTSIGHDLNIIGQHVMDFNVQMKYGAPLPDGRVLYRFSLDNPDIKPAFENAISWNPGGGSGGGILHGISFADSMGQTLETLKGWNPGGASGGGNAGGGSGGGGGQSF